MADGIRKVAGKIITRPMGEYDAATTYDILDFVTIGNKLYISKKTGLVGVDPSTDDGTNWQMLIDGSADLEAFEATVDEKIATVNSDIYDIVERLTADESSIDAAQSRANEAYSLADSVGAALTENVANMNGQLTNFESRITALETKINNLTFNINTDTGNLEWGME